MTSTERDAVNGRAKALAEAAHGLNTRNPSYLNDGIYRHYKGGLYWLLEVARDATSKEERAKTVVYTNLLPDENGWYNLYSRTYEDFCQYVEVEGKTALRFVWLGYTLPDDIG